MRQLQASDCENRSFAPASIDEHGGAIGPGALYAVLGSMFLLANLVNLYLSRTSSAGDIAVFAVALVSLPVTLHGGWRKLDVWLVLSFLPLLLTYGLSTLEFPSFDAAKHTVSIVVVLATLIFFYAFSEALFKSRVFLCAVVFAALMTFLVRFTPYAPNKNTASGAFAYIVFLAALIYAGRSNRPGWLIPAALFTTIGVVAFLEGDRGVAGLSLLGLTMFFGLKLVRNGIVVHYGIFPVMIVSIGLLVAVFTQPSLLEMLHEFSQIITDETGRPATSGREVIWPIILDAVSREMWFGLGAGTVLGDLVTTRLSAHSMYLQVLMQTGVVGLSSFLLVLFSLWRSARPRRQEGDKTFRIILTSILFFVVLHNAAETFLIQNALVIGIPAWICIGVGLGHLAQTFKGRTVPFELRGVNAPPPVHRWRAS